MRSRSTIDACERLGDAQRRLEHRVAEPAAHDVGSDHGRHALLDRRRQLLIPEGEDLPHFAIDVCQHFAASSQLIREGAEGGQRPLEHREDRGRRHEPDEVFPVDDHDATHVGHCGALFLNVHVHALVLDGVCAKDGSGVVGFHPGPSRLTRWRPEVTIGA
jgi:hypothetical protein